MAAYLAPEAAPEPEVVPQETAETDEPQAEVPEDDSEDFDLDGSVVRIPKDLKPKLQDLKDGYLRREDYTRKTQELADLHRQAQLVAETLTQRQQFENEVSKERGELAKITADLDRYKAVDWSSLEVNDYIKLKGQMDTLKDKSQELTQVINGKIGEFSQKHEANRRKLTEEGQKHLQKAIPNWGTEAVAMANDSAKSAGYTQGELENVYDARFVVLAWKAAQYDKLQTGKSAAVASVQKAPPVVKPGAGLGPGVAAENKYREIRSAQKKSGSVADTARLLMLRGLK